MRQPVRIAVIGAGPVAVERHLPSLARLENAAVVGLCDRDNERLLVAGEACHVPADRRFTDHRQMLETVRPDAVYAIMPPHHVVPLALEIMDRGHALFIEKPPGISTADAREMAQMAARKRVVTAVAFQRRYHPLVRACWAEVTAEGRALHRVRVSYHKWCPPEQGEPYYGGIIDILRCDAIHAVDAARFYAGLAAVRDVQAVVRRVGTPYPNCFQAMVTFENGVVAGLDADWASGRRFFKFEFHAAGACAYIDIDGRGEVWKENGKTPAFESAYDTIVRSPDPNENGGFLAENRAFVDAVRAGRAPHNSLEDAVRTMELIDAIYEKAALGAEKNGL